MTSSDTRRTVILATVIPGAAVLAAVAVAVWVCVRRRKTGLFNRGITPIADEEIESWKNEKDDPIPMADAIPSPKRQTLPSRDEAAGAQVQPAPGHSHNKSSVSSIQKPASVIVYQNSQPKVSGEHSPGPASAKPSVDLSPQTPILARAPNARPGLTDEAVQGDDAFIVNQVRRQHSRLSKNHQRHRSAYPSVATSSTPRDRAAPPRKSADNIPRASSARRHDRFYSAAGNPPPRLSLDDAVQPEGLSPRPAFHKSEIGRAIG